MIFKLDYNKKIKCPKLTLKTAGDSDDNSIGILQLGDKPEFELNANDLSILKFKIYEKLDGKNIPYYSLVDNGKLVHTEKLGVYRIVDTEETRTGKVAYKEVTAKTREYDLKSRKIFDINGVFSLYDVADESSSLMHIICGSLGNWSIGHIDNNLISLYRTFDVDSIDAYSLLVDKIATSFQCVVQFDTYNRTINIYSIENYGKKVNVLLTYRNLVQQNIITRSLDDVFTVFRVRGGNNLDIMDINPTGLNTIMNFDALMIKKSDGGDASDSLVDAWNTYKTKYESLVTTQTANNNTLKTYYSELTSLQTKVPTTVTNDWTQYGLDGLNEKKSAYQVVLSTLLSNGAGSPSSPQYPEYSTDYNILRSIDSEIAIRESQITSKKSQITSLQLSISSIANELSMTKNFTAEQIKELYSFYREGEYVDETYVVADTDTNETKLEVEKQLFEVASEELVRASQPLYSIDTTLNNLFTLPEFKNYHDDFSLGNIITIKVSDYYIATARLLSIKIDFNKLEDISVVFSNRNRLDNSTIDLAKITAQAQNTSNAVSIGGKAWDVAAATSNILKERMSSALNAGVQEIKNSDNEDVLIGEFGIRLREKNEISGLYSPEEMWLVKNKIMLSDDNFASAKECIGKYTYNGNSYYGLIGEAIVSPIIIGESTYLYNKAGNYSIDNNGFNAYATVGSNIYSVGINPSIPANIFNIKVNGINKFYMDIVNSQLVLDSKIISTSGNIGGWDITPDGLTSTNTIASLNLFNQGNKAMTLSYNGLHLYNHYSGNNEYLGGALTIWNKTNGVNGIALTHSSTAEFIGFGYIDSTYPYSGAPVNLDLIYSRNGYPAINGSSEIKPGFTFNKNVYVNGNLNCSTINGNVPLTSSNVNSYISTNAITPNLTADNNIDYAGSVNGASVTYVQTYFARLSDLSALNDKISALATRVSALE